jgi:hypothetical protein
MATVSDIGIGRKDVARRSYQMSRRLVRGLPSIAFIAFILLLFCLVSTVQAPTFPTKTSRAKAIIFTLPPMILRVRLAGLEHWQCSLFGGAAVLIDTWNSPCNYADEFSTFTGGHRQWPSKH